MKESKPEKIEPEYRYDPEYQNMMHLISDKKDLKTLLDMFIEIINARKVYDETSENETFKSKIDVLEQTINEMTEEDKEKRKYSPELIEFAKSLVEEYFIARYTQPKK